ncbi:hypothetical protein BJX99DRAFT_259837, partial [Aspergillus californicus]
TSAFTASLHSLGANYTGQLVERAKTLHGNSAALSSQEEQLARTTGDLRRQNESWGVVAEEARRGLKEIGDVQNWAEMIERDLLVVEESLRLAELGDGDGDYEGDGDGDERSEEGRGEDRDGRKRVNVDEIEERVNGGVNGKVDEDEEEDAKSKGKARAKGKEAVKKGWFSWW